ncbi:helix-turn-helix transcriptional regulator [Pseudomonas yangonensis]|uniref:helix-turn-helix transcriptional regulator n=1 Tax=Pseudomonas yangonensis TaxID=2579922 RepID=UPI0013798BEB|nr:AlpA family phage regulatory protein [Pseudomonas yangonensis]
MQSLLRLPAVMNATGLTRSTLYLRIKQRLMTPPVKLGERVAAWPADEVEAINAARIAGKTTEEIRELVTQLEQQRAAKA